MSDIYIYIYIYIWSNVSSYNLDYANSNLRSFHNNIAEICDLREHHKLIIMYSLIKPT